MKFFTCMIVAGWATTGAVGTAEAEPNLSGVWQLEAPVSVLHTDKGALPPLTPQAAGAYQMHVTAARKGDRSWDSIEACKPLGVPRASIQYGWPFELMQSSDRVDFLYQWDRLDRAVLMSDSFPVGSGQEGEGPYYMGNSIGRWDGATLVVRLRQEDSATTLDASGLPHSDSMTLLERFSLAENGKRLVVKMHVIDPAIYTIPWDATLVFARAPSGTRIKTDICADRHPGLFATIDSVVMK